MEEFLSQVDEKTHTMAVDKLDHIRAQLKHDLADTFITREYLDQKIAHIDEKFQHMDSTFNGRLEHLESKVDERFEHFESKFNDKLEHLESKFNDRLEHNENMFNTRFKHLDFKLNIIIGVAVIGLTLANSSFLSLLKYLFK